MSKKFHKNIYDRLLFKNSVYYAIDETRRSIKESDARRGLKNKRIKELENEDYICDQVLSCLNNENYIPKDYNEFIEVENGKERFIQACSDPVDKVIQKMLTIELKRILEPMLHELSLCNVKNRGINRGVDYIKKIFKREERLEYFHKKEGKSYKKATSNVLKMDINKCYESINKSKLKKMLKSKIKDKRFIDLLFKFVNKYKRGLGLGGGMCSVLANFYFIRIDEYILNTIRKKRGKHKGKRLKTGYYLRYMDDMVVFATSKAILKEIYNTLSNIILKEYGLTIKGNWYIAPMYPKDGVSWNNVRRLDFLGYTFSPKNIHIRKRTKIKIIRLLREVAKKGIKKLSNKKLKSLSSYLGYLKTSNGYYLVRKYYSKTRSLKRDIRQTLKNRRYKKEAYKYLATIKGIIGLEELVKQIKRGLISFGKRLLGK